MIDSRKLLIKALNYGRTTLFIHKVPVISVAPNLTSPIKIYGYTIQNHREIFVNEYAVVSDFDEPQVPLDTIILADTTELTRILRIYSWRDYNDVVFNSTSSHLLKLKLISDEEFEINIDSSIARTLEGTSVSTYKIRLLLEGLTIMKKLRINRVKIFFSKESPMLIKSLTRVYPRIWIAPSIPD